MKSHLIVLCASVCLAVLPPAFAAVVGPVDPPAAPPTQTTEHAYLNESGTATSARGLSHAPATLNVTGNVTRSAPQTPVGQAAYGTQTYGDGLLDARLNLSGTVYTFSVRFHAEDAPHAARGIDGANFTLQQVGARGATGVTTFELRGGYAQLDASGNYTVVSHATLTLVTSAGAEPTEYHVALEGTLAYR